MPPKPGTAAQGAVPQGLGQPAPTLVALADGESGKLVLLGLQRQDKVLYFIKAGDVWATPMRSPGLGAEQKPYCVAKLGLQMDFERYLYYLDNDGDVARKARQIAGARR